MSFKNVTRSLVPAVLILAISATTAKAQTVRSENILPLATDPAITGWFGAHRVSYAPDITPRQQLFLFLHGQGGSGTGASELVKTAAELGFHAVGLTYPNDWSPFVVCSSDPACPENLRREIIDGTDRTPLITVSRANSIESRLLKLLSHLNTLHPDENWMQYVADGQIAWNSVVVWGHSQGGGNAGVIAKHRTLARLCTSAPAADGGPGNSAAWWSGGATPGEDCFGFCHTQDALNVKVAFWDAIGMGAFGGVLDIATNPPPFGNTHKLSSSIEPAIVGQYHNSVVMDAVTPRDATNTPIYKPVWQYMLTAAGGGTGGGNGAVWNDVPFATVPTFSGTTTLMMDIYAANTGSGARPLLVWIHGGGWQGGSHNQVPQMALALRDRGVTVASIGYRLSGEAIFPAQIHDCKAAIRFLRANAATYNIDPSRIAVWGSSAGGHLAALVGTTGNAPSIEGDVGGNLGFSSSVLAIATYFGPTDLLNMALDCDLQSIGCTINHDDPTSGESKLLGLTGANEGIGWLRANAANPAPPFPEKMALAASVNPITHLDAEDPPMYIAHGDLDTTVPLNQSTRLHNAAITTGVQHEYVVVPGASHGFLGTAAGEVTGDWIVSKLNLCPCAADADCSGTLGTQDIFTFLNLWFAGLPAADFNHAGGLTTQDIFDFLNAWFAGC